MPLSWRILLWKHELWEMQTTDIPHTYWRMFFQRRKWEWSIFLQELSPPGLLLGNPGFQHRRTFEVKFLFAEILAEATSRANLTMSYQLNSGFYINQAKVA